MIRTATGAVGVAFVAIVLLAAVVSIVWTPYPAAEINPAAVLEPPSSSHWLGTDPFGRDVLSQLMVGARVTVIVAIVSVAVSALVGIPLGILSALYAGWWGQTLSRSNEILLAFPALIVVIILAAGFGASSATATIAIAVGSLPAFALVARSTSQVVLAAPYVDAARLAEIRNVGLRIRHLLPNSASTLLVQASIVFAFAILTEAALSYLGLGTAPPTPTWGAMLQEAQGYLGSAPRLAIFPGLAIAIAVLGFTLIGDAARDRIDPRLRGEL